MDDGENFRVVKEALKVMELSAEEQDALFHLVAVVIHIGNIEFASGDGGRARIVNPDLVTTIAQVCGDESFPFPPHQDMNNAALIHTRRKSCSFILIPRNSQTL